MRLTLLPGRTRVALLLGLIVAVLLAVPATAYAADPPPDQTISGTVTDESNGGRLYGIGVTLYYYEGLTLAEIGAVLGVTESRICQIHTKAVLSLRNRLMEPGQRPG